MSSEHPVRSRPRPRAIASLVAAIVAIGLLYGTVVTLYAMGGNVAVAGSTGPVLPGDLELTISPTQMEANANRLSVRIDPTDLGAYTEDGFTPSRSLHLVVTGTDGPRSIELATGEIAAPSTVALLADGYVEQWPFDRYTARAMIVPTIVDEDDEAVPVPYQVHATGRVPGWAIQATGVVIDTVTTADGEVPLIAVDFVATRAVSTIVFGVVLLSLMVIVPVLVLIAAFTVLRGRRKVEVTMLGWIGAMLFATIPLRTFLPGSPPIGSWVDYLIVLWVIAALVAGLVIFIVAWLRHGPEGPRP